jgi:hypothetical protein
MKRTLINENEKNKILTQHKDFKKILEEKKIILNKGLMIEQRVQDPIFLDKFTISQVISKCVKNPNVAAVNTLFRGKPSIKVNAGPDNVKIYTNEPNTNFGGYNFYILNTDENKILKGPMSWKCSKLYAEDDAKTAADKKAEEDKKTQAQQGLTKQQQEYKTGLEGQGYVIDPSSWDIQNKNLKQINPSSIPGFRADIFPNGLNVWADPTKLKDLDIDSYKEREKNKTPDVNKCKDFVQTYWNSYKSSDADNSAMDTDTLKTKNIVQACANHWYPKWTGLSGGVLGIGDGQNRLNDKIDVLTGRKTSYEGVGIPSRTTNWGLRAPKTQR